MLIAQDVIAGIASSFVAARRQARVVATYPGERPTALDDAYRIQDAAIALEGGQVAGWKVGRINPPVDGVNRLAGPIFAHHIRPAGEPSLPMPVFAGGFAAAEAEFLLRIGTAPDPAKRSYSIEDARALIDAVHVGIEIASSPYPGINADGPLVTISDFGNNNGLVIGPAVEGWQALDLLGWPVALDVNGTTIGTGTAAKMLDGPFGAARFLFELMATRGIALRPGDWISSGAVTGVHEVEVGDRIEARFGGAHVVACTIATSEAQG